MASRKGKENKSTALVKDLVRNNVNFPNLIKKLQARAMKRFGKAPQPLEHSGDVGVKIIKDNI
jgi:hypothetical protein